MKNNQAFGVEPVPNYRGPGFVSTVWAPGLAPHTMKQNGSVLIFDTEDEAKLAGIEELLHILNMPRERDRRTSKPERYEKLSGPEFANLLAEAGITMKFFCYLYSTTEKRVFQWIDGFNEKGQEELAPHPVRVLLEIFKAFPETIDLAENVTDKVTVNTLREKLRREGIIT